MVTLYKWLSNLRNLNQPVFSFLGSASSGQGVAPGFYSVRLWLGWQWLPSICSLCQCGRWPQIKSNQVRHTEAGCHHASLHFCGSDKCSTLWKQKSVIFSWGRGSCESGWITTESIIENLRGTKWSFLTGWRQMVVVQYWALTAILTRQWVGMGSKEGTDCWVEYKEFVTLL